jgi:hypothetical protein
MATVVDPVCGMQIESGEAAGRAEFEGAGTNSWQILAITSRKISAGALENPCTVGLVACLTAGLSPKPAYVPHTNLRTVH